MAHRFQVRSWAGRTQWSEGRGERRCRFCPLAAWMAASHYPDDMRRTRLLDHRRANPESRTATQIAQRHKVALDPGPALSSRAHRGLGSFIVNPTSEKLG